MQSGQPIKKFPLYVCASFGTEVSNLTFEDQADSAQFESLFIIDQYADQVDALRYAEQEFLNNDIRTMTPDDLIKFIKKLHHFSSNALMLARGDMKPAGEFTTTPTAIRQETGIPNTNFSVNLTYSEKNEQILNQVYGRETANQYKEFITAIEQRSYWESENDLLDIILNNTDNPYYSAYHRVLQIIQPEKIPEKMFDFFATLLDKINRGVDPIECATYALYTLITTHAFAHGNRRTARIFMNCMLMNLGVKPILIPKIDVNKYYLAMALLNKSFLKK